MALWQHVGLAWHGREKATSGLADRRAKKSKHQPMQHEEERKEMHRTSSTRKDSWASTNVTAT